MKYAKSLRYEVFVYRRGAYERMLGGEVWLARLLSSIKEQFLPGLEAGDDYGCCEEDENRMIEIPQEFLESNCKLELADYWQISPDSRTSLRSTGKIKESRAVVQAEEWLKEIENHPPQKFYPYGEEFALNWIPGDLNFPFSKIEFSVRASQCLRESNVNTIGDLINLTPDELLRFKNFGEKSLSEIRDFLQSVGLSLKDDDFVKEDIAKKDIDKTSTNLPICLIGSRLSSSVFHQR